MVLNWAPLQWIQCPTVGDTLTIDLYTILFSAESIFYNGGKNGKLGERVGGGGGIMPASINRSNLGDDLYEMGMKEVGAFDNSTDSHHNPSLQQSNSKEDIVRLS